MNDTETINVIITGETPAAYRFQNEGEDEAWFPKSEVVFESKNINTGKAKVNVPIWLLEKKGW